MNKGLVIPWCEAVPRASMALSGKCTTFPAFVRTAPAETQTAALMNMLSGCKVMAQGKYPRVILGAFFCSFEAYISGVK